MTGLAGAIAAADLVITCTGATGTVISTDLVAQAVEARTATAAPAAGRPLFLLDLALPHDVQPEVAGLPGVSLLGLDALGHRSAPGLPGVALREADVAAVRTIVAEEFAARVSAVHAARVAPTVVALRAKAATVVDAEMARLAGRLQPEDHRTLQEVERAMRRVVDKLLHAPTVRVKELAGSPGGDSYEDALRVLFDLDPAVIAAVTVADGAAVETDNNAVQAGNAAVQTAAGEDDT